MADEAEQQQEQPEASSLAGENPPGVLEEEEKEQVSAPTQAPAPTRAQPTTTTTPTTTKPTPQIKPYRPLSRFLHPFYWGNVVLFASLYAAFRAQWLSRAAAFAADAASSSSPTNPTNPHQRPKTIPYSRALTKPSDLLGWERQVLFTFAVIALYKTFLKRRSWDGAAAHYLFYARLLVAVVLFYCDWRWLVLHALCCWFSYAALAQPLLDLDAIASARMLAQKKELDDKAARRAVVAASASASASSSANANAKSPQPQQPPLISGVSIPMNPPRLRQLVLVEESAAEAEAAAAAALASASGGSTKKTAKLLRQQLYVKGEDGSSALAAGALEGVGVADYWVLLVGCLSGGHHADSAAYAPAHHALAERYGEEEDDKDQVDDQNNNQTNRRPRLRFAHLDASLFGAYCASNPVLALPPPQQLTWSRSVPCVLLIDGRSGKELARLPTRAQAEDPFRRNLYTAADVERAFDLAGIHEGNAPRLAAAAAATGAGAGGDDGGGGQGEEETKRKKVKSKDV